MVKFYHLFEFKIYCYCHKRTPTDETLYLLYKHFLFTLAEMFANAIGQDRKRNNTENLNSRRKFLKCTLPHNNAYKVQ